MAISVAEKILKLFPLTISNLSEKFSSHEEFCQFLNGLGWDFPINEVPDLGELVQQFNKLVDAVFSLEDADNTGAYLTSSLEILYELYFTVDKLKAISAFFEAVSNSWGALDDFQEEFPEQLINYLIIEYFEENYPGTYGLFRIVGIIEVDKNFITYTSAGEVDTNRVPYDRKHIHFDRLGDFTQNPTKFLVDLYQWGSQQFNAQKLIDLLEDICIDLGLPAGQYLAHPTIAANLLGIPEPTYAEIGKELHIPIYEMPDEEIGYVEAGVNVYPLPLKEENLPGLSLIPYLNGGAGVIIDIGGNSLLEISGELSSGVAIVIRPGSAETKNNLLSKSPVDFNGKLQATFSRKQTGEFIAIFGKQGQSRLGFHDISQTVGVEVYSDDDPEVFIELNLKEGEFVIDISEGDNFITKVLSNIDFEALFDITIGWSNSNGVYFKGSGGVEISIPTHVDLGPIELLSTLIAFKPAIEKLPFEIGTVLKGDLGPLQFAIENIGFKTDFSFPVEGNGNLGPLDLDFGFKPPNGLGLAINAGVIKGGGYLRFDHDRGEYDGALELVFSEWIALKAIGLITTKMPDGSKGFSLLIIITAEFGAGIQLGYGFTLLGVGGLLGWNRSVNIEALKEGVKTGGIANVLFPEDVVANAPRIISDLKKFFPPAKDSFLIGPMAKIGWWSPQIIDVTIGIILEFPQISITILGVLKATLPNEAEAEEGAAEGAEEKEILKLQVNFLGRIEPSNKLMWFYAELFDSRLLKFTLEGSMGVLLSWGDNPNFVLSVGGFHPRYTPPPLPFPNPKRIALTILNKPAAKIRLENYFAVTSNTVQFGARAELHFGFSEVNVDGFIGFDTLFQFDPFYFISEFSAGLSVKVFGFGLYTFAATGMLEGPTQWHIKGKAKMKLTWLGPTIKVSIDKTWGEEQQTVLPPIPVLPLLVKEFSAITNWVAVMPEHSSVLVTLRKENEPQPGSAREAETKDKPLVFHPEGKIRISQCRIPINLKLDWIGNQRPSDVNNFSVTAKVNEKEDLVIEKVMEKFAPSQFKDLDNAKKLSSPGFEWYEGGIEIKPKGEQLKTSMAVKRIIRPETIIIDTNYNRKKIEFFKKVQEGFAAIQHKLFHHFLKGNAVSKSTLSQYHRKQMQPNAEGIRILPNQYSIVDVETNKPYGENPPQFSSKTGAIDYMEEQIKNNPGNATRLQVIPNTELNVA